MWLRPCYDRQPPAYDVTFVQAGGRSFVAFVEDDELIAAAGPAKDGVAWNARR
jgi:hypothetical protein